MLINTPLHGVDELTYILINVCRKCHEKLDTDGNRFFGWNISKTFNRLVRRILTFHVNSL